MKSLVALANEEATKADGSQSSPFREPSRRDIKAAFKIADGMNHLYCFFSV
jgi:hypothetical protein